MVSHVHFCTPLKAFYGEEDLGGIIYLNLEVDIVAVLNPSLSAQCISSEVLLQTSAQLQDHRNATIMLLILSLLCFPFFSSAIRVSSCMCTRG